MTQAEAKRIAALPVAQRGPVLFNRVYGVGNPTKMREFNNTGANDGWLYRGGGMMQATGKSNYVERPISGSTWLVYDANSGRHRTRIHARSIASFRIVNPRGARFALQ